MMQLYECVKRGGCNEELSLLELVKLLRVIYRARYASYDIQGGVVSDRSGEGTMGM